MPRFSRFLSFAAIVLFSTTSAPALTPEQLENATDSAVYLRVFRVFQNTQFPTTGSGFFVHPDGYVVTNWHVVADEIEMSVFGKPKLINAKVLKLEVVINSGTAEERVVRGKVISTDRRRDLALIKLNTTAPAWFDISDLPNVALTDQVWVVGFPFGGLLSLDRMTTSEFDGASPEVTVNSGLVTSLRHDDHGKLASVQTDAAVNPGNSGGPLLDEQGRLVGVVRSMVWGGQGLGFAISPNVVEKFLRSRAVKVKFEPRIVLSPPQPIRVTVNPRLISGSFDTASIEVAMGGLPKVQVELERSSTGAWTGSLVLPEVYGSNSAPSRIIADLRMTSLDGEAPLHRRYGIDRMTSGGVASINSHNDPARVMGERKVASGELSLENHTKVRKSKGKGLSGLAASLDLKKNESGSIVIDQRTVDAIGNPLLRRLPESRYEELETMGQRKAAALFDVVEVAEAELGRYERMFTNYKSSRLPRERQEAAQAKRYINEFQAIIRAEATNARLGVKRHNLVFCEDSEKWYVEMMLPKDCKDTLRP